MRQLVFIKQVPEVAEMRFDPASKRIIREGIPTAVNPFDRRALTEAIRLRTTHGGTVVAVTMGPLQAREALVEALAVGADRGVHLLDPAFAGADTLATARTLAAAATRLGYDLIWCGKYSVDADTGQVGPELAELLDLPQATGVFRLTVEQRQFEATRETDEGHEVLAGALPVVLTASERLNKPLKADPAGTEAARGKPVAVWTAGDLGLAPAVTGAAGSPTWVARIETMAVERASRRLDGTAAEVARALVTALQQRRLFEPRAASDRQGVRPAHVTGPALWAVSEASGDELRAISLELLGGAAGVAGALGGHTVAVVLGEEQGRHARTLARYGADQILLLEGPGLDQYSAEAWASALTEAIERRRPWAVLFPATADGRDYAPRVAARLGLGLTGDAIGLQLDDSGRLVQLKPSFGGNVVASVLTRTDPQLGTVRPGMLTPVDRSPGREAMLDRLAVTPHRARLRRLEVRRDAAAASHALDHPEVVVTVGTGVGGPENLAIVHDLAHELEAAVGATRKVADLGWLPRQQQVGLTGRSVKPRLYIAVGVGGSFNHLIGMLRSEVVVAINRDPEAAMCKVADYALVGDLHQLVPALTAAFRDAKVQATQQAIAPTQLPR
jgi:electron transfer flavoprotein alpha subunit